MVCETWSLALVEERTLWVFENRVLRRIVGSKRDVLTGEWTKLHNEELNDIRGVTGGTDQTSGGCSLCYTIPI